jgi:hypothetical protein
VRCQRTELLVTTPRTFSLNMRSHYLNP